MELVTYLSTLCSNLPYLTRLLFTLMIEPSIKSPRIETLELYLTFPCITLCSDDQLLNCAYLPPYHHFYSIQHMQSNFGPSRLLIVLLPSAIFHSAASLNFLKPSYDIISSLLKKSSVMYPLTALRGIFFQNQASCLTPTF